ncbi:hypothetical protein EZJ49_00395 [Bdellovibrio bacteriovorus]|uniref:hypothetical protein n=1 Tax=Bdellovibrio bacteriovorus TaxID=959 RepID=UPI0021CE744F|nr:hypothetical protein [Bdellovibrio bacteriovorus]UXR64713.1 hypothetical protein EZJ49_00395 [Bdellovibrio bacteriovorus]
MVQRRVYAVDITVNGLRLSQVIIDPHYELKLSTSITDELILRLVHLLDGNDFSPEADDEAYEYFVTENMRLDGKLYRLIWLTEKGKFYLGVVNAYRRR